MIVYCPSYLSRYKQSLHIFLAWPNLSPIWHSHLLSARRSLNFSGVQHLQFLLNAVRMDHCPFPVLKESHRTLFGRSCRLLPLPGKWSEFLSSREGSLAVPDLRVSSKFLTAFSSKVALTWRSTIPRPREELWSYAQLLAGRFSWIGKISPGNRSRTWSFSFWALQHLQIGHRCGTSESSTNSFSIARVNLLLCHLFQIPTSFAKCLLSMGFFATLA